MIAGMENGIYSVVMLDGREYRAELDNGRWYFADGTGWREPFAEGEKPVRARLMVRCLLDGWDRLVVSNQG